VYCQRCVHEGLGKSQPAADPAPALHANVILLVSDYALLEVLKRGVILNLQFKGYYWAKASFSTAFEAGLACRDLEPWRFHRIQENTRIHELSTLICVHSVSKQVLHSKVLSGPPPSAFPPTPPPFGSHPAHRNTLNPQQHHVHRPATRHQRPRTSKTSVPPSK
jgi:hypothetical protein